MIEINSNSLKDTKLAVADILDSYTSKLSQSKDIPIKMSVEEYITIVSALRYAISYLRGGQDNDSK
jgi:hypothetical protein